MNCEDWATLLDAFVDGELADQQAQQVRVHLETCETCRTYVSDAWAIRDAFPSVDEEAVPEDFVQSVMARIETQQRPKEKKIIHWHRYALGAVACLTLVVTVKTGLPSFGTHGERATTMTTTATMDTAAPVMETELEMTTEESEQPRAAMSFAMADVAEEIYAQQATLTLEQVGLLLDGYGAAQWEDGTLVYVLTQDGFWEILSQIEGDTLLESGENPTTELCRILVR